MKWVRKSLLVTCVLTLSLTLILAGCTSSNNNEEKTSPTASSSTNVDNGDTGLSGDVVSAPGQFPIVDEKITLRVLVPQSPIIIDYATNEFTKWYEEKTNIHIEWDVVPVDALKEKVNLILASGDYPDVFFGTDISTGLEELYGVEQQLLLPLDNLIDKYGVELKNIFESNPTLKGTITATDGKVYGLPAWNDCYHCTFAQKMWIHKGWLENLNLKMPETTEEFYNMLKAFKENDPNGNNKADEIPLAGAVDGWMGGVNDFILNAFTYSNGYDALKLILKDGKISTILNTPEYREGLRYLNKLYEEGLIYSPSYTQRNEQLRALAANPGDEILGAFASGANVNVIDGASDPERYENYVALPPLKGPDSVRNATHFKFSAATLGSFYISASSKHPEAAFRWADALYSDDVIIRKFMGEENVHWKKAEPGEIGINGEPALYTRIAPYSEEPQNSHFFNIGITYLTNEFRFGESVPDDLDITKPEGLEKLLVEETKNKYEPYAPSDNLSILPPIRLLDNENQAIQTLSVELSNYAGESMVRFITGDLDLDNNWDSYVKSLETIGLQTLIDTYQVGYDRQFK